VKAVLLKKENVKRRADIKPQRGGDENGEMTAK